MAEYDYTDLDNKIAESICTCTTKDGWTRDPDTEFWVCGKCRKPSRYCAVAKCIECDSNYLLSRGDISHYEPICPVCTGEQGENECITTTKMVNGLPSLVIAK